MALCQISLAGESDKNHYKVKAVGYKAMPVSAESKAGSLIFQKNSCAQCHTTSTRGGCLGPLLSGIGGRRTQKFILDRITAGAAEEKEFASLYGQAELMPHPRLPRRQSRMVVSYLMTLAEPREGFTVKAHALKSGSASGAALDTAKATNESIAGGKKLFYNAGCMSCHSIGKIGGQFATELDDVGTRKGREYISARMNGAEMLTLGSNDEYNERGTAMTPSNLDPSQIKSITDFLMSLSAKQ